MSPKRWFGSVRRVQLVIVTNVALLGFLTLVFWLLLDGAASAADTAARDLLRSKAGIAKRLFESEESLSALHAIEFASKEEGLRVARNRPSQTRVFRRGATLDFLPRTCFLQYGDESSSRFEACIASPNPRATYYLYFEGAFCTDNERQHQDEIVSSFNYARMEILPPDHGPLRWWIKPEIDKTLKGADAEPKATAFVVEDWSKNPTGRPDSRIAGVIWPSEERDLCEGLSGSPAIPIRLRIDGHCLFLHNKHGSLPSWKGCAAHREDYKHDLELEQNDFLDYEFWTNRVRFGFQVVDHSNRDAGGVADWSGIQWRSKPQTTQVGLDSLAGFILGPGESLTVGDAIPGQCPHSSIARLPAAPSTTVDRGWRELVAEHMVRMHVWLLQTPQEPQIECAAIGSTSGLGLQLVREAASVEADVVNRLATHLDRAFLAVCATLLLFFIVNGAILFPLALLVGHTRKQALLTSNARPEPFPFQRRSDEIGALASSLQTLVNRVARQSAEATAYNITLSHEIKSPLHSLHSSHADNPNVRRMMNAVMAVDSLTNMVKSQLPDTSVEDLGEYLAEYIGSKQETHGPIEFDRDPNNVYPYLRRGLLLDSVLDNLFGNAARYRKVGTPITVRLSSGRGYHYVDIHNTGPEIPASLHESIFAFGYSTSTGGDNQGVGLFVSRYYMQMIDGRLDCVPTDHGAIFRLTIPVAEDQHRVR